MKLFRQWFTAPAILLLLLPTTASWAQSNASAPPSSSQNAKNNQDNQDTVEPDEPVASNAQKLKSDQAQALLTAWEMLQSAGYASKPRDHVSLLVALGTMGGYKQAEDMLASAMKDRDFDIRLTAVVAAGA